MIKNKRRKSLSDYLKAAGLVAIPLFMGMGASLGTTTYTGPTMGVSSAVVASCTATATSIAFGNYTLAAINANGTITVTCTSGTSYNVGISAGTSSGATVTTRKMVGTPTTNTLAYTLTSGSASGANWGATSGTDTVSGTGNGAAQNLTVYGTVAANQTAPVGSYSDTVTVTLIY